jgi:hypothetical protein
MPNQEPKVLNIAQQLLALMKIPFTKDYGKNRSNTKKGPGRKHKQGWFVRSAGVKI